MTDLCILPRTALIEAIVYLEDQLTQGDFEEDLLRDNLDVMTDDELRDEVEAYHHEIG